MVFDKLLYYSRNLFFEKLEKRGQTDEQDLPIKSPRWRLKTLTPLVPCVSSQMISNHIKLLEKLFSGLGERQLFLVILMDEPDGQSFGKIN